jgi:hypothetical protein
VQISVYDYNLHLLLYNIKEFYYIQ